MKKKIVLLILFFICFLIPNVQASDLVIKQKFNVGWNISVAEKIKLNYKKQKCTECMGYNICVTVLPQNNGAIFYYEVYYGAKKVSNMIASPIVKAHYNEKILIPIVDSTNPKEKITLELTLLN